MLPTSRLFPRLDHDFMAGLRAAFASAGHDHDVVIEPIGNATAKDTIIEKMQRILLQSDPDIITAVIGTAMLPHVQSYADNSQVPLIVNNLGADPLVNGGAPSPYVFHNSYNLWQSCYALGDWAAQHLGKTACVATGLHEAGYGMTHAFWSGFAQAGGSVIATEVTHKNSSTEDPTDSLQRIAAKKPDFFMAFYSGREAGSFSSAYRALGLLESMPLLVSPLMLHPHWREQLGDLPGVRTAFSWPAPDSDLFGVLGYETGLIINDVISSGCDHGPELRQAIGEVNVTSKRGPVRFDPGRQTAVTTDYLLQTAEASNNSYDVIAVGRLELPTGYWSDFDQFVRQEVRPGWINPYLVT